VAEHVNLTVRRDEMRARIILNSPKGNVLTTAVAQAIRVKLASLNDVMALRLVTVEAAGQDFSFGASIQEHASDRIERMLPEVNGIIRDLLDLPVPTAAVVKGRCLGAGFELALACDFIFAADDAVLGLPEVSLAAFPPAASALLPMRLGYARATDAILTGEARSGAEWHATGLVTKVFALDQIEAEVEAWFDRNLSGRSASGLRHAVAASRLGLRKHVAEVLPDLERLYLNELMRTVDVNEAVAAFLGKRAPNWTD
jgi:cyclohexa-1,5-dienecarbonyl-CoA hydratase